MARNNRHNAAFVVGAVLGGLVGSAAALWKTPYSGDELRARIAGGAQASAGTGEKGADAQSLTYTPEHGQSLKDKVLSTVENTLAPVVGVQLGKTANESGSTTTVTSRTESVSAAPAAGDSVSSSRDVGAPPAFPDEEPLGDLVDDEPETGGTANVTPVDRDGGVPSRMSSPTEPVSMDNAASVEDLTTPHTHIVPDALKDKENEMQPFPKLGGNESS